MELVVASGGLELGARAGWKRGHTQPSVIWGYDQAQEGVCGPRCYAFLYAALGVMIRSWGRASFSVKV